MLAQLVFGPRFIGGWIGIGSEAFPFGHSIAHTLAPAILALADDFRVMSAADTLEMLAALEGRGIAAWLDGGWGIDALLGEQTRPHEDLDLVVGLDDVPALIAELGDRGFRLTEGRPHSNFVLTDASHRKVDVHPVAFDDEGNGHYTMENDEIWIYPGNGFAGTGRLGDKAVRCLTPEVQVLCHKGYELDEEDVRDLEALRVRFRVG